MGKQKAPRRVAENEALAVGTTIHGSAQKLNLVAGLIRGKKAEEAMNILAFSKRAMARDAQKVLASAIANAENNHNLDVDLLIVREATVGKTMVMKRFHARGRGRSAAVEKPFSNITIIVEEKAAGEAPAKAKKQTAAKAEKPAKSEGKAKAAKPAAKKTTSKE